MYSLPKPPKDGKKKQRNQRNQNNQNQNNQNQNNQLDSLNSSNSPSRQQSNQSIPRNRRDRNNQLVDSSNVPLLESPPRSTRTRYVQNNRRNQNNQLGNANVPLLRGGRHEINVPLLTTAKYRDKNISIQDLIFEETLDAKQAMEDYRRNRPHAETDVRLFKSILATAELQKSGAYNRLERGRLDALTSNEQKLMNYVDEPYELDSNRPLRSDDPLKATAPLARVYGLNEAQHRAVIAYTFPSKTEQTVNGSPNPWYMGDHPTNWGIYKNGWVALQQALEKLPNLGDLGLEVTTYRASRQKQEIDRLLKLDLGTNIYHGAQQMLQGQRHYVSTALSTAQSHGDRAVNTGGIIAYTGTSGVLINPFGGQEFSTDGGEILYPPGTLTRLEQVTEDGYSDRNGTVPVIHLREIDYSEAGTKVVEDLDYTNVSEQSATLNAERFSLIQDIQTHIDVFGVDLLEDAKRQNNLDDSIRDFMRFTIEELRSIQQYMAEPFS